jgi:hypothetical protein
MEFWKTKSPLGAEVEVNTIGDGEIEEVGEGLAVEVDVGKLEGDGDVGKLVGEGNVGVTDGEREGKGEGESEGEGERDDVGAESDVGPA